MNKGRSVSKIRSWDRRIPEDDILKMEDYLGKLMAPVRPRDEFVQNLRQGLGNAEYRTTQQGNFGLFEKLFWIGAGFASAIVFLTVGIRVIINLVKRSNLKNIRRRKGIPLLPWRRNV